MGIEWNEEGLAEFERHIKDQLSGDIRIPLGGSEDDAVRSVIDQLQSKGLETNDAEVTRWVRDHRAANQAGTGQ